MTKLTLARFPFLAFALAVAIGTVLAAQSTSEPRRFAILVGINQYADQTILQLQKAQKDAEDLAAVLESSGSYRAVKLMSGSLAYLDPLFPSRDNVIAQVEQLAGMLRPGDQVLFFFSGHGLNDPKSGDSFLLTIDTKARDFTGSSLNLQKDVLARFDAAGIGNVVALVDACQKSVSADKGLSVVGVDQIRAGGRAVVITATGPGKASYEDPKGGNGLFTTGLLAAFTGAADQDRNGEITVAELETYLPDAVSELAFKANYNQQPMVYDTGNGGRQPSLGKIGRLPPASGRTAATMPAVARVEAAPPARKVWELIKNPGTMAMSNGVLLDGAIYYVGGLMLDAKNRAEYVKSIKVFNLELAQFSSAASLKFDGYAVSVQGHEGKLYYAGGVNSALALMNQFEVFDPATRSVASLGKLKSARAGHAMAVLDGKIYFMGGVLGSIFAGPSAQVDVYDIGARTWNRAKDMLTKRSGAATVAVNGKIYVFGGYATNTKCLDSIECYDPVTNTWTQSKAVLPAALANIGAVLLDGRVYLLGGDFDPLGKQTASTRIFTFDPLADKLTTRKEQLPVPLGQCLSASAYNGKIYVSGGVLESDTHNINANVYVFDPALAQ